MHVDLEKKLHLFISNANGIKKGFPWQEPMAKRLAALIYALDGKELDANALAQNHRMIKEETGLFSTFRGNLSVYIAAMMAMKANPHERFAEVREVYALLKAEKFRMSDYLAAAAYEIASQAKREDYPHIARRAREFLVGMRANNRWLVCTDDYIYSAMLALSDLDVAVGCERIKHVYDCLKMNFPFTMSRNCLLHLSQIMVLSDKTERCIENLIHMNRILRSHKIRLDRAMILPSLGILSMLPTDPDTLADQIFSVTDYIRKQKGFGKLKVSNGEVMMQAVALISDSELAKTALSTAVTNIIIAQQTAMMVAIIASTSAAASAAATAG
ncbi:MAG: DUF4003 domain-containing protein [Defluviitaleaceae bacterium]|nr:DUF4003 domain-containing protein [Defluviitaleaceae bacterium]